MLLYAFFNVVLHLYFFITHCANKWIFFFMALHNMKHYFLIWIKNMVSNLQTNALLVFWLFSDIFIADFL